MGPRCAPTLILAVLQPTNSQSEKPILKIILASNSMQVSCILFYETRQKGLGNSWNFGGFPEVFPSLIFSHSKLGIPFTSGPKGI